jgi:hypothetical protein
VAPTFHQKGDPIGMAHYGWHLLNAMYIANRQQTGLDCIRKYGDVNDAEILYYLEFGSTRGDSRLQR